MDGSHPANDPVEHAHVVQMEWFRTELGFHWSFTPDWDVEIGLPYDVKSMNARYHLPDGSPYDSPTGRLHHRTETLEGPSDFRLLLNFRKADVVLKKDWLRIGAGVSLPTGEIEDNPYALAALGIEHQHVQFGNGTFDPIFRLDYGLYPGVLGIETSFGIQAPLYENRKEYQGSTVVDFSIGPRIQLADRAAFGIRYVLLYQGRAYWEGETDRNSGYLLHAISVAIPVRLAPAVAIVPTVLVPFSLSTAEGADTFEMDWMLGLAVEVTLGSGTR